jgi:hypothetical protein
MGWVVNTIPRPLYSGERDSVAIVEKAGWVPGPVWKISPLPGFNPKTVQSIDYYIPGINHVSMVYNFTAILKLK